MGEGRAQVVEVRIERPPLAGSTSANRPMSLRGEEAVARALSVRLRAVSGRFIIEAASPETQWDQGGVSGRLASDAAIWRFNVTPLTPGKGAIQLAVSARTIGADGVLVETGVPEQTQEMRISPAIDGWLRMAGAAAGWMVLGIALVKLAERVFNFDVLFFLR